MRLTVTMLLIALTAPAYGGGPLGNVAVAGQKSRVATIGSEHLSGHKEWTPAMLEPLVAKLAAFRPTVVTIESLSGEQCDHLKRVPARHVDAWSTYCGDPSTLLGDTRLTVPEAIRAVDETLAGWPARPTAAQRRRLAMLFLAAGENASARVQWLRLPEAERRAGDGLTDKMVALIVRKDKAMNESFDVAAAVAARVGLERVHAVDDHSSDATIATLGKPFEDAMAAHFDAARSSPLFADYQRRVAAVKDGATLLAYFRQMNAPHAQDEQIRGDFGGALAQDRPGTPARAYVGWWDVRNLRMAANIRESFADKPGARVLNIVGASHKPWYDALMGMMADVEVVDAAGILR